MADLKDELRQARVEDEQELRDRVAEHQAALEEALAVRELAGRVLKGDTDAYIEVFQEMSELSEVSKLGETMTLTVHDARRVSVVLDAHSDEIVPTTIKSQLASGKLSEKKMPVGKRWSLYQDHICSAALRVARDLFGLLPVDLVRVTR